MSVVIATLELVYKASVQSRKDKVIKKTFNFNGLVYNKKYYFSDSTIACHKITNSSEHKWI